MRHQAIVMDSSGSAYDVEVISTWSPGSYELVLFAVLSVCIVIRTAQSTDFITSPE